MGESHVHPETRAIAVNPKVRSLVLADRIYRDEGTNKFVLAGTFNRIHAPTFPWVYPGGASLYLSLTDFQGVRTLGLQFKEAEGDVVLFEAQIEVRSDDPLSTLELRLPLPPLPLPKPGNYAFEVYAEDGEMLSMARLRVEHRKPDQK